MQIDPALFKEAGERGYLTGACGLPGYPTQYTRPRDSKSVDPKEWDAFHEFIIYDEICRAGSGGVVWFLFGGYTIGLPPLFTFGSQALKNRILPGLFAGDKRICLCITEPDAGSDVAGLKTTAEKTPDGKHYIVNGVKKWITNGIWADYFTVAVRTGGPGSSGISIFWLKRPSQVLASVRFTHRVWACPARPTLNLRMSRSLWRTCLARKMRALRSS